MQVISSSGRKCCVFVCWPLFQRANSHKSAAAAVNITAAACCHSPIVCVCAHVYATQRITFAQLHSLHLGGREGLHAPALRSFMAAFRAAECRRPLVVEVKGLQTDAAREELLHLLRCVAVGTTVCL